MITNPKVFVADGAKWIWRWVEDNYPGAIQILDYYHAVEKIEDLAKHQYGDEQKRKLWLDQQKDLLLDDEVLKEISNIKNIRSKSQPASKAKQIAINYYEQHEDRMLYKTYKDKGLLIG